jgi:hypothetical protein
MGFLGIEQGQDLRNDSPGPRACLAEGDRLLGPGHGTPEAGCRFLPFRLPMRPKRRLRQPGFQHPEAQRGRQPGNDLGYQR